MTVSHEPFSLSFFFYWEDRNQIVYIDLKKNGMVDTLVRYSFPRLISVVMVINCYQVLIDDHLSLALIITMMIVWPTNDQRLIMIHLRVKFEMYIKKA
ncbi:hypothetical protein CLU79DRAFT_216053 [Phycomyces nitens]|nr:hypothetical protein CLU79DRAFT_216053 [Phycomyces nitens]